MEARELRIGNYVKLYRYLYDENDNQTKHLECENYLITSISNCEYLQYEPIPLTEEWLIKFGFESIGTLNPTYKSNPFIIELIVLGEYYTFRKIMNKEESIRLRDITKVHQLQNLFYALTGTELTINHK